MARHKDVVVGACVRKLFLVKLPGSSMSWRVMCDNVMFKAMFVDGIVEMWNEKLETAGRNLRILVRETQAWKPEGTCILLEENRNIV